MAAVPFEGQDSQWGDRARNDYEKLLLCASTVHVVCERDVFEEVGPAWCMQKRNEWMVDNSGGVLALWNGDRSGGTFNCLEYAKLGRRQIKNLWAEWDAYHLVLANPRPLAEPIPYKGALGLRRLDDEMVARIEAAIA